MADTDIAHTALSVPVVSEPSTSSNPAPAPTAVSDTSTPREGAQPEHIETTDAPAPLSKKAQKRLAKAAFFQERKLERRQREKAAKKEKKRERRERIAAGEIDEDEDEESNKKRRKLSVPVIPFKGRIVGKAYIPNTILSTLMYFNASGPRIRRHDDREGAHTIAFPPTLSKTYIYRKSTL